MTELDQLRKFIDSRIKMLDNEQIKAIEDLDFDTSLIKSNVSAELYGIKAELNRLSWLSMESKLQTTQKIEPIIINELKS